MNTGIRVSLPRIATVFLLAFSAIVIASPDVRGTRSLASVRGAADPEASARAGETASSVSAGLLRSATSGCTSLGFSKTDTVVNDNQGNIAVGDFNRDGKPDFAVTLPHLNKIKVFLNDGAGGFTASDGPSSNFPVGAAAGDFNRDGMQDLVVTNISEAKVSVMLGTGTGSFGVPVAFATGTSPNFVSVADLNHDGKDDLAVANFVGSISILLGTGTGTFGAATNFATDSPFDVQIADLNRDGHPDLITTNKSMATPEVSVLLGNGTGAFGAPTSFSVGSQATSVAVGDFDLDGKLDLATANFGGANVSLLRGNGTGGFAAAINVSLGGRPNFVVAGDFNADGKPDLAVSNFESDNVTLLIGNGLGGFAAAASPTSNVNPYALAASDFNLDGRLDLFVSYIGSLSVSVLRNTCGGACIAPSFGAQTNYPVADTINGEAIAAGDLNRDGKLDLVITNSGSNSFSLLNGTGSGGFGAAATFPVGQVPTGVAIADLNYDGKLDLAVANSAAGQTLFVIPGDGAGSFVSPTGYGVGTNGRAVAVGDFNRDGRPDLAVANAGSANVSVLLGTGGGSFGFGPTLTVGTTPFALVVSDFNRDGKPDIATANRDSANVSVLLGDGAGAFAAATSFAAGNSPVGIAVGDFNQDGVPDLAVANNSADKVSVLLGNGSGAFGAPTQFSVQTGPSFVAVSDVDLDGKPDLVASNQTSGSVSILRGNGAGGFSPAVNFTATGTAPRSLVVGDFNSDGRPDLALPSYTAPFAAVLLNNCTSNTPPTITPLAVNVQQGSLAATLPIANVDDLESPKTSLSVAVNGSTSATFNGVTVSGLTVSAAGVVSANVVATCGASSATFNLRVTDPDNALAEATLSVTVAANTGPILTYASPQNVIVGGSVTLNPATGPTDNGTVDAVVVQSKGTFTGTVSVNAAGVVSVSGAGPVGAHTIQIRATDNCGAETVATFVLAVNRIASSISDPAICTGPGGKVFVSAAVTNESGSSQPGTFTATLPSGLSALPGTCTSSIGTCFVIDAATVTWSGAIPAGQSVAINYQAQIGDQVTPGTQFCISSSATVGGSPSGTVLACVSASCPGVGPGLLPLVSSPSSDQRPGSVLVYSIYTSNPSSPTTQNTRFNMTNISPQLPVIAHLFFVDGSSCSVADMYVCLTPSQTISFLASEFDPGTTGYLVAVAVDRTGCPTNANNLIGDELVKFSTSHAANLGAEAIAALAGGLPACNPTSTTATLRFDGVSYNPLPRVLALDSIPAKADGNDTLLIVNRFGGDLATSAGGIGALFGILYNDAEQSHSFNLNSNACQLRGSLSGTFPRTTPRFESVIPAGTAGWLKLWGASDIALLGVAINYNPNAGIDAGAFNQGRSLHKLRLTTSASMTIPVFPAHCN